MRRTARWQRTLDERILEHLYEESWSTPGCMETEPAIDATKAQIRDRCRILADAGLVAVHRDDGWYVELTTLGQQYLEGEADLGLYPRPRPPGVLERI
jgi:hypothetical protein